MPVTSVSMKPDIKGDFNIISNPNMKKWYMTANYVNTSSQHREV